MSSMTKKFNPNSFCIDDVFKYIEKKGKFFKESIAKDSKKKKKKKAVSDKEAAIMARVNELNAEKKYTEADVVTVNV